MSDDDDQASERGMIVMLLHVLVIVGIAIYFLNR